MYMKLNFDRHFLKSFIYIFPFESFSKIKLDVVSHFKTRKNNYSDSNPIKVFKIVLISVFKWNSFKFILNKKELF